jgi:Gram-negative bacterial TonB protein C-terminal
LSNDQPKALEPMTILYKHLVEYTEIARINRLKGPFVLSALFLANGHLTGIKVVRGLPDGLTRRGIHAMQCVRFTPTSLNGTPVSRREMVEFDLDPG